MTLDRRRSGDAIAGSAEDLARVWRAGRASTRPIAFPGLLDGVVEPFLRAAGEALASDRDPATVWPATSGVVRLDARDRESTLEELEAEWDLVREVLGAALRALGADEGASVWMERALETARAGTRALSGAGAPGIVAAHLHSDPAAMRRARSGEPS